MKNEIKLFEQQKVRTHWDEKEEKWYFSIIDVIAILTASSNPRDYWFKMKTRVKTEDGLELSTVCRQLKMKATDGKMRETGVAETQVSLSFNYQILKIKNENIYKTITAFIATCFCIVTVSAKIGQSAYCS